MFVFAVRDPRNRDVASHEPDNWHLAEVKCDEQLCIHVEREEDGVWTRTTYSNSSDPGNEDGLEQRAEAGNHVMVTHGTKISVSRCNTNGTVQMATMCRDESEDESTECFPGLRFWTRP